MEVAAVFGYIRVSQAEGESGLATRRRILNDHGLRDDRLYTDVASGRTMRRPAWKQLRETLQPGDVVVVPRMRPPGAEPDRGAQDHSRSCTPRAFTSAPLRRANGHRRRQPHMLLSLAKWERETIRDRIKAGVDRAAAEGRTGGRPPALDSEKLQAVRDFLDNGGSVSAAARAFGVSRPTVRAVKDGTYPDQNGSAF